MNRREAISRVTLLLGGTMIGADAFLSGCRPKSDGNGALLKLTGSDKALLDEVAETIIPATDTPGAKSIKTGAFMEMMVRDCYNENHQKVFLAGLVKIEEDCNSYCHKSFANINKAERVAFLTTLDAQQKAYQKVKPKTAPPHYFRMFKELTILGFCTSEIGATQALRYSPVPGKYEGCIPYKKGDRNWATE